MNVKALNEMDDANLYEQLEKCCGSSNWIVGMMNARPFTSKDDLIQKSNEVWATCKPKDGLEAFEHHPKIGDKKSLEAKFASTKEWAGSEQSGVDSAAHDVLDNLAAANQKYEERFGYIFIVCATGKSATEMLDILNSRLNNDPEKEISVAMAEQHKITTLRLHKLLSE